MKKIITGVLLSTLLASKGQLLSGEARGFLARVIQHETDHLQGKLFIDYVKPEAMLSLEEYRKRRAAALDK